MGREVEIFDSGAALFDRDFLFLGYFLRYFIFPAIRDFVLINLVNDSFSGIDWST